MLDIKFIRENRAIVALAAKKKRLKFDVEKLLTVDDERRALLTVIEAKRAEQNESSGKIASMGKGHDRDALLADLKKLKESLKAEEDKLAETMKRWRTLMLEVPNIPDMSVPEGESEKDNVEARVWGTKPSLAFSPKDHIELMTSLSMIDFERGVKAHGFRGYFLKGDGAQLTWALWNYARDFYGKKNYEPFIAPTIVREEFFYGTGHLPNEAEDLYETQDKDYLTGTAEVSMMAYHAGEMLREDELPRRYLAFSPCYRREAGSYGKDVKGIIRVHEFFKIEQLVLSKADHAESARIHEEINRNFEELLESLELPYRRLLICTGDLAPSKVKQYDTEAWFPSQNEYRELSSASYYHDFQSRRFDIRYSSGGKKPYVHSLNCTAIATPRIIGAIVENNQQPDGSVKIPKVLVPYMGMDRIVAKR